MGLMPYWIVVARWSTDLALAGFIYDFAVAAGWAIGVLLFKGETLGPWQYLGMALMVLGILCFRK
jgi:drug/metabolite transporter (DMT)-like permease